MAEFDTSCPSIYAQSRECEEGYLHAGILEEAPENPPCVAWFRAIGDDGFLGHLRSCCGWSILRHDAAATAADRHQLQGRYGTRDPRLYRSNGAGYPHSGLSAQSGGGWEPHVCRQR